MNDELEARRMALVRQYARELAEISDLTGRERVDALNACWFRNKMRKNIVNDDGAQKSEDYAM